MDKLPSLDPNQVYYFGVFITLSIISFLIGLSGKKDDLKSYIENKGWRKYDLKIRVIGGVAFFAMFLITRFAVMAIMNVNTPR